MTILVTACAASVGTGGGVSVPKDAKPQCATICTEIGASLSQVVVMANAVGCVCDVQKSASNAGGGPAGAAGGAVAMMVQQQAAQQAASHH
jgi:hypothetical protein